MNTQIIEAVDKAIEKELDNHINNIGSSEQTIMILGEFVDGLYKAGNFEAGEFFRPSLEILIPKILSKISLSCSFCEPHLLIKACEFANEYYYLRDLIYISFSTENSIEWKSSNNSYEIEIKDHSIFRQIAAEIQSFALNSEEKNDNFFRIKEILHLISGTNLQDVDNTDLSLALESIKKEVEWKIHHFFSYIPEQSSIDIGGYKYCEFLSVYKELLFLSLYERYHSAANDLSCVITYYEEELSEAIAHETFIEKERCTIIIRDIAASSRCTFNYIPMTRKYLLFPFSFSLKDGISAILKYYARKDSNAFSANCSGMIGDALVDKVAEYFEKYRNFRVFKEVKLNKYSSELPDIDLLVISYEPSLGFHCFCCEMKNNLPASWAKEHLKAIGEKGFVQKALSQSEKISNFLKSKAGSEFLCEKIVLAFSTIDYKKLFPTGFCAVIDSLIVTSQSIGMFFPNKKTTIINKDLLCHFVARSDGDVNFICYNLRSIDRLLDNCYTLKKKMITAADINIVYDVAHLNKILSFPKNEYLSADELEKLENESLESGYRFIDYIE